MKVSKNPLLAYKERRGYTYAKLGRMCELSSTTVQKICKSDPWDLQMMSLLTTYTIKSVTTVDLGYWVQKYVFPEILIK